MGWLWGHTGKSFVDVWSIFHVAFWLVVGSVLWSREHAQALLGKPSMRARNTVICVGVALLWEAFERGAERWWPTLWLNSESWYNSWLSDPLTCVVGVMFASFALDHWRRP